MSTFTISIVGDLHIEGAGGYDGSDLVIPEADLILGIGDWVNHGNPAEYEQALHWAKRLGRLFPLVRGNHDNGRWHHYARQVCPVDVVHQLEAHGRGENLQVVEWAPMIWRPAPGVIASFPKTSAWETLPATIQANIIKLRDITPAYYRFDAGGMRFICLDTSDWLLGAAQVAWLTREVAASDLPIVLVGHHHFLPVGNHVDIAQVDEHAFLRTLVLDHPKLVAYLHGHAHKDRWWRYGGKDIIATGFRTCRTVTIQDGRVVASGLNGAPDQPAIFQTDYLCARNRRPGPTVSCAWDDQFDSPWKKTKIDCLAWLPPNQAGEVDLEWTMRWPSNVSARPHQLVFQIYATGRCQFTVTASGLTAATTQEVAPASDGRTVTIPIGALVAGNLEARLTPFEGGGYVAAAAGIQAQ